MPEIEIAVANSRNSPNWKNRKIEWSDFTKKLSKTHRTAETLTEYLKMKKDRQDEVKDVGGFVGGYLTGGKRKKDKVAFRSILALDADKAQADLWETFTLLYGHTACLYSTHKHSPDNPRYRLIIPFNRHVMPDEYCAIGRFLAAQLGINQFDHTGFQPERLMYWPSSSKDGVYDFQQQDGDLMNPDKVLAQYFNWKDSSEWAMTDAEISIPGREATKQGEPTEKPHAIGAFCRAFGMQEAIETFLSDIYEPSGQDERYTYVHGSTAGGLILYDDKFAFSHHGTDPASGRLYNAFDLVRVHMFGLMDEDRDVDTPINKLPSFDAMNDFAMKQKAVRKMLGVERLENAHEDFKDLLTEEVGSGEEGVDDLDDDLFALDWLGELEATKKGRYLSTIDNVVMVLRNDPFLKGRMGYDLFAHREAMIKTLPWKRPRDSKYLIGKDEAALRHFIEKTYHIKGKSIIEDACSVVMQENAFHPVKQFIESAKWDGKKRISTIFTDFLGAEDCRYTRKVARKVFTAAIARIYSPGIKFDDMPVLIGPQGLGKSTLFSKLCGKWFSDSFVGVDGPKAFEQLQGVWCMEIGELAGFKSAEVESVKSFLSKLVDRFRVAYGRVVEDFPRTVFFIGTSNEDMPLKDRSGNRRFDPIKCNVVKPDLDVFQITEEDAKQVWAEALVMYNSGEKLYFDEETKKIAEKMQDLHVKKDDREPLIAEFLKMKLPTDWETKTIWERREYIEVGVEGTEDRKRVCAAEIWCELFKKDKADMTSHNTRFIHDYMRKAKNWEPYKSRTVIKGYGNQIAYFNAKFAIELGF